MNICPQCGDKQGCACTGVTTQDLCASCQQKQKAEELKKAEEQYYKEQQQTQSTE